ALWAWAVAAGVLAGLLSWQGGEGARRSFRAALEPKIVPFPTMADQDRVIRGLVRSAAVSYIQQGAILGAVLGLAGGLARRSAWVGPAAAAIGLVLGGA